VRRIIFESPIKSCALDPIPTTLLQEIIDVLLPFVTHKCNAPLKVGCLTASCDNYPHTKEAFTGCITSNYRPVSNLTFISKVVERMVAGQMMDYLRSSALRPELQSAYEKHHPTKTALLSVASDYVLAADTGSVTLLGLLDLSAAFDTVDTGILVRRLQNTFGIGRTVLKWVTSFLQSLTQQVSVGESKSVIREVLSGVPQGSVLGPPSIIVYKAGLFKVIADCGMSTHSYADDTQIYTSTSASNSQTAVSTMTDCVEQVHEWMSSNRLTLNRVIWLGTRQQLAKLNMADI